MDTTGKKRIVYHGSPTAGLSSIDPNVSSVENANSIPKVWAFDADIASPEMAVDKLTPYTIAKGVGGQIPEGGSVGSIYIGEAEDLVNVAAASVGSPIASTQKPVKVLEEISLKGRTPEEVIQALNEAMGRVTAKTAQQAVISSKPNKLSKEEFALATQQRKQAAIDAANAKKVSKQNPVKVGKTAEQVSTRVGRTQKKSVIQNARMLSEIPDDIPAGLTPEERAEVYYQMPESKRPLLSSLPQEDIDAIKMRAHELDSLDAESAAYQNRLLEKRKKLAEARARGRAKPKRKQDKTTSRPSANTSNMTPEQRKQAAIQRGRATQPSQQASSPKMTPEERKQAAINRGKKTPKDMLEAAKARGSAISGDIVETGVDEFGNPVIIGDISGGAADFIDNSRSLYGLDR
jgi:hypothetical protein